MIPRGVISEKKKGKGMFKSRLAFLSVGEEKKKGGGGTGTGGVFKKCTEACWEGGGGYLYVRFL